jgi:hypothetical protein
MEGPQESSFEMAFDFHADNVKAIESNVKCSSLASEISRSKNKRPAVTKGT